jgi:virulence-associated protein VagC
MGEITIATVFDHDGSLAVDLPEGFQTTDGKVRIIQHGNVIHIEPATEPKSITEQTVDRNLENLRATVKRVREHGTAYPNPPVVIGRRQTDSEIEAMFKKIDDLTKGSFMPNGREQPPMPEDDDELSFD